MPDTLPTLSISPEKICYIVVKAREFDAKDIVTDPDEGSNATDDNMIDVLEDNGDDPVAQEITGFINALSVDEQIDLLTLLRLGRGDGTVADWDEMRAEAAREHDRHVARYLLGQPMLGDLLEQGLDELGLSGDGEHITPVS